MSVHFINVGDGLSLIKLSWVRVSPLMEIRMDILFSSTKWYILNAVVSEFISLKESRKIDISGKHSSFNRKKPK